MATEGAKRAGQKNKLYYDKNVRYTAIEPGDLVLIKNIGIKGKHKPADIWDSYPYIVKSQPIPDIPVYEVQREHTNRKCTLLQRNLLLPFNCIPNLEQIEKAKAIEKTKVDVTAEELSSDSLSSENTESEELEDESEDERHNVNDEDHTPEPLPQRGRSLQRRVADTPVQTNISQQPLR